METVINYSLIIHVIAGFSALVLGAAAIFFKKKTAKHKPLGRYYFYAMSIIFVTGVFLSVMHEKLFLFFISFFTYYSTIVAYRAIVLKNDPAELLDKLVDIIAGLTNASLLLFGIYVMIRNQSSTALIPMVFGIIGLAGVNANIKRYYRPAIRPTEWLERHIGNMLGSYIGAITAFTVNQAWKYGVPDIISWLGPTIILVPVIIMEIRKMKGKKVVAGS